MATSFRDNSKAVRAWLEQENVAAFQSPSGSLGPQARETGDLSGSASNVDNNIAQNNNEGNPFEQSPAVQDDNLQGSRIVLGNVSPEMAGELPLNRPGNIFIEPEDLKHIEDGDGRQIRSVGFNNAMDFINYALAMVTK